MAKGKIIKAIDSLISSSDELDASEDIKLLADELLDNGAKITKDGNVVGYHRTSKDSAESIYSTGKMIGDEDGLFFSTTPDGQISGYGDSLVEAKIPLSKIRIDDIFGDEAHIRVPTKRAGAAENISSWLSKNKNNRTASILPIGIGGSFLTHEQAMAQQIANTPYRQPSIGEVLASGAPASSISAPKSQTLLNVADAAQQWSDWRDSNLPAPVNFLLPGQPDPEYIRNRAYGREPSTWEKIKFGLSFL